MIINKHYTFFLFFFFFLDFFLEDVEEVGGASLNFLETGASVNVLFLGGEVSENIDKNVMWNWQTVRYFVDQILIDCCS